MTNLSSQLRELFSFAIKQSLDFYKSNLKIHLWNNQGNLNTDYLLHYIKESLLLCITKSFEIRHILKYLWLKWYKKKSGHLLMSGDRLIIFSYLCVCLEVSIVKYKLYNILNIKKYTYVQQSKYLDSNK